MREIYGAIAQRLHAQRPFAVATLLEARGAKASPVGTSLLVDSGGSFLGDIGAGCHEGEIAERAMRMIARDEPPVKLTFELEDELLAGSGCGATLDVALWRPPASFAATAEAIACGTQEVTFSLEGVTITVPRRPILVIVGATALAAEVTLLAQRADYTVSVVDPRPPFASRARHPHADELLVVWPDDAAARGRMQKAHAVAVLSHDVKLDVPALRAALASPAPYIGLLGNRRVQSARRETLRSEGYDDAQLARIAGPAGLDLGGVTDGQTAVAIVAEMLAVERKRSAEPLSGGSGPIH